MRSRTATAGPSSTPASARRIARPAGKRRWPGPLGGRPITRVICTHMHPDHIGLAGWLCERFDAPLLMTRLEYVTGRMLFADTGPAPESGRGLLAGRRLGRGPDRTLPPDLRHVRPRACRPMPASYRPAERGRGPVASAARTGRIVIGNGHSPEHACLWRKSDDVFIVGRPDPAAHLVQHLRLADRAAADPLDDWLTSLDGWATCCPTRPSSCPATASPSPASCRASRP